jgi:hypothetical protein
MQDSLGKLRNRKDAAAYIREKYARPCTVGLLNKLAVKGTGPEFRRSGARFVHTVWKLHSRAIFR